MSQSHITQSHDIEKVRKDSKTDNIIQYSYSILAL